LLIILRSVDSFLGINLIASLIDATSTLGRTWFAPEGQQRLKERVQVITGEAVGSRVILGEIEARVTASIQK
jgi:hypothetical protein